MSAAAFVTSPNPSYPMNNTPAPNNIDFASGHNAGERLAGLMNHRPTPANNMRMPTLMATITVSDRPMIFAPSALTNVRTNTAATASDFTNSADGVVVTNVA